jgi:hypothetical protein
VSRESGFAVVGSLGSAGEGAPLEASMVSAVISAAAETTSSHVRPLTVRVAGIPSGSLNSMRAELMLSVDDTMTENRAPSATGARSACAVRVRRRSMNTDASGQPGGAS